MYSKQYNHKSKKGFKNINLMNIGLTIISLGLLINTALAANECTDLIKAEKVYDAVDVCTKMAKKGDVPAQFALGTLYFQGKGVMADKKQGFKWIKHAAEAGMPLAQYNVGIMLANGLGVESNLEKAYTWMYVAEKYGYTEAKDPMQKMAKELSSKEKERAVKAAKILLGEETESTEEKEEDASAETQEK